MNKKILVVGSLALVLSGCSTLRDTTLLGAGFGAAAGTGIGLGVSSNVGSAAIGAGIGAVIGATLFYLGGKAELSYTGTHIMRHGGCRRVYNQGGDLAVAQQLLGNTDLKSTLVYAKRSANALTEAAQEYWDKGSRLAANGCKTNG